MKEIYATTRVRSRDIAEGRYMGTSLRDSAIRDLVRGLMEQLQRQAVIEYREELDPETGDLVVRASVYVAEPGERVTGSYGRSPVSNAMDMTLPELPPIGRIAATEKRDASFYLNMGRRSGKTLMTEMALARSPEPSSLTEAKMKEAIDSMRRAAQEQTAKFFMAPLFMEQLKPLSFMGSRMERKKAQQDGEVAALLKARGEKEVRERTKRRGVELKIEVGVRKITMPEEKKETG